MNGLLNKAIVTHYYKLNAGFFLVLFLLLFGLLNGQATIDLHHFLMQNIMSDYRFLLGAMGIWLIYTVKSASFVHKELRNPSNVYLFTMQSLGNGRQFGIWLLCHMQLMLPVLVYGAFTIAIGIANGHIGFAGIFLAYQAMLCGLSAALTCNTINSTWKHVLPPLPTLLRRSRKHAITFLLHYSMHMRKGTFIGLKILSVLLLKGLITANEVEINKESVAVLMMFLISANSLLPFYYVRFAETQLSFLRNMPVKQASLFLATAFTYAIIFIPELAFLLLNSQHALSLAIITDLYFVAISQMMLYTALQYVPRLTTDKYFLLVAGLFFATLLFLASFNLALLAATELIVATVLFKLFYRNYELPVTL